MTAGVPPSVRALDAPIDWRRMAEPCADQYDSRATLELARRGGYDRPARDGAPRVFGALALVEAPGWLGPTCQPAPVDHPNIARGESVLRLWPEGFGQLQILVDSVALFVEPGVADGVTGSICGPGPGGFGSVAVTLTHHVGLAEALVQELAHHKLWALGVGVETATRLVLNEPQERFHSPIRYDSLRPMSAVLHAQYSYAYVAALDLAILRAALDPRRDDVVVRYSLAVVLPKLVFGRDVISRHVRTDRAGADFLEGLLAWLDRLLAEGHRVLADRGVAPVAFEQPLAHEAAVAASGARPRPLDSVLAARPRRRGGLVPAELPDELLLYAPDQDLAFSLNRSARQIWELCEGSATVAEVTATLASRIGVPADALVPDVVDGVRQLQALRLLELDESRADRG